MAATLPEPIDLSHHLSRTTQRRQASFVKAMYKYFSIPGIGQLAGGLPCNDYFPFDNLEAKTAVPERFKPGPNDPIKIPPKKLDHKKSIPSGRILVPADSGVADPAHKIDTSVALQYMTATGFPPLANWVREFTRNHMHPNVPYNGGPETIMTCGTTDGFAKVLQCFNNEWTDGRDPISEKEGLLCEEHAYMGAIQSASPRGMTIAPVAVDVQGMRVSGPGGLQDVLENWDFSRGRRPHLMYTVTMGQNPTSGILSVARRKEIYTLCVKYDILILEDDPYWYLQYPSSNPLPPYALPAGHKSSGYPFLDSLIPSYLSIDTQGRVIRLDTFSKTVAPGCRLGWITAPPAIIERLTRITEGTSGHPSGFVQSMLAELILGPQSRSDPGIGGSKDGHGWATDGWVRWLEGLRNNYERRMTKMCDVLDEGKDVVRGQMRREPHAYADEDAWTFLTAKPIFTFTRPLGGMFVWLHFHFETHPLSHRVPAARLSHALWVFWTTEKYKILAAPGTIFSPTPEVREEKGWQFFRLCFCHVEEEELEGLSRRFTKGANDFWRIKSVSKIDEILKDEDPSENAVLQYAEARPDLGSLMGFGC